MTSYNQVKADETGLSYYQATAGTWGCNLWAASMDDAASIIYQFYPEKSQVALTITAIVTPQPTKTKNGGNNNG